jgi:hypothetical protein
MLGERERLARCIGRLAQHTLRKASLEDFSARRRKERAGRTRSPDFFRADAFHKNAKLASVTAIAPIAVANAAVHAAFR